MRTVKTFVYREVAGMQRLEASGVSHHNHTVVVLLETTKIRGNSTANTIREQQTLSF